MIRKIINLISFLILLDCSTFADPITNLIIEEIKKKTAKVNSCKAVYIIKLGRSETKMDSYWEIDKGLKVIVYNNKDEKIQLKLLNNEEYLSYDFRKNYLIKVSIPKLEEEADFTLLASILFGSLKVPVRPFWNLNTADLKYEKIDKINGEYVYVFSYKVPEMVENELVYFDAKILIKVKDGIWVKNFIYSNDGEILLEETLINIEINPEFGENFFSFHLPEDSKSIDLTQNWIEILRLLK